MLSCLRPHRSVVSVSSCLALSVALSGAAYVVPSTAQAGKVDFRLRAKAAETPGKARATGTLRLQRDYTKRGTKHRVVVTGKLDDRCPGDGYGAVLYVRVYFSDSNSDVAYMSDRVDDARTCGASPRRFKMVTNWTRHAYKVELGLYEYDVDTGDIANQDAHRVDWTVDQLGG
jgi:hypothetical protein